MGNCDKTWILHNSKTAGAYYRQVAAYTQYLASTQRVELHGFTIAEMDNVKEEILSIEGIRQIDITNLYTRRGL